MTKTLLEIRHALLDYFSQENSINPKLHSQLIKFECNDAALKEAIVTSSLRDLEKLEIVRSVESGQDVWFILVKPLEMYEQSLTLSYSTCIDLANVINSYCKSINNTKELCDATNIKERDIQKIVIMLDSILPKE